MWKGKIVDIFIEIFRENYVYRCLLKEDIYGLEGYWKVKVDVLVYCWGKIIGYMRWVGIVMFK